MEMPTLARVTSVSAILLNQAPVSVPVAEPFSRKAVQLAPGRPPSETRRADRPVDDAGVGDAGDMVAVLGQELEDWAGVAVWNPHLPAAVHAKVDVQADLQAG